MENSSSSSVLNRMLVVRAGLDHNFSIHFAKKISNCLQQRNTHMLGNLLNKC